MLVSLSDHGPSLPDVQSLGNCCFVGFVLFFSYFGWEGKSVPCYSSSYIGGFESSTPTWLQGGRYLLFLPLTGTGVPAQASPEQPPSTSFHSPTLPFPTLPVRKRWRNPCKRLLTIFFEDLFLHLVPHFDVLCLFYLDVSVRIKERDIHRAWHIAHARGVYIAPRFSILPAHHSNK